MKSKVKYIIFIIIIMIILIGCPPTDTSDDTSSSNSNNENCKILSEGYKYYSVDIEGRWTAANFSGNKIVANAHFSPFVVFTHKSSVVIFKSGELASPELEVLAETGGTGITSLYGTNSDIGCVIVGTGLSDGGQSQSLKIPVSNTYNTITVLSMIAPSSDWFVGEKIALTNGGNSDSDFLASGSEDMNNYDAGTEQDTTPFSGNNTAEPTHLVISRLANPFATTDVLVKIQYKLIQ